MKLYAEVPRYRMGQIVRDLAAVAWVAIWVRVGFRIHELVSALAGPGRTIQSPGTDVASSLESAGSEVEDLPVVGDALRTPFEAIAGAGRALERAGATQQEVVATLAVWLGVILALIPILYVALKYLPDRGRWIRAASAADHIRLDAGDLHLFALRAVANRPLHELRRASSDPAGDLASGNYQALARLELNALGLSSERGHRS